ncbi:hypothetical protein T484DRAFT_1939497, partial [Baffinella frigidus]
ALHAAAVLLPGDFTSQAGQTAGQMGTSEGALVERLANSIAAADPQVLRLEQPALISLIDRAIAARFDELLQGTGRQRQGSAGAPSIPAHQFVDLQELRQVHQYLLTRQLEQRGRSRPEAGPSLMPPPSGAYPFSETQLGDSAHFRTPSGCPVKVEEALRDAGIPFTTEAIDADSGYSIDILAYQNQDEDSAMPSPLPARFGASHRAAAIAIEVDGPGHFARPALRAPLGSTALKQRHLRQLGWHAVSIAFWEWNALRREPHGVRDFILATFPRTALHPGGSGDAEGRGSPGGNVRADAAAAEVACEVEMEGLIAGT